MSDVAKKIMEGLLCQECCILIDSDQPGYLRTCESCKHEMKKEAQTKPTNPKDACGILKSPMSNVPGRVIQELGVAMHEGALKYGRHNWRVVGVRASVYYDACMRHLITWWEGEDIDSEAGVSHLTKAMACLAVLRDSQMMRNLNDDRPPRLPVEIGEMRWQPHLNQFTAVLTERNPNPEPPNTHVRSTQEESSCEESSPGEEGHNICPNTECC